ncbi:MAG: hypothetical protein WC527_00100 [Candidatus Margulisiibacteriota bacterium]
MKKITILFAILFSAMAVSGAALATGTGDINVGTPLFKAGYTSPTWQFQTFEGTPLLFSLTTNNLKTADRTNAVAGATLNGTTTVAKTAVTAKDIAILNHVAGFTIYPNTASSPFPSMWIKGTETNPGTGADDPDTYLTGTDADKFFQQGLTIQAPYYDVANYQWTVYVFADKDLLTQTAGPATGKVLDPRIATMRWYAWTDDSNGIAKKAFGYRNFGDTSPTLFNTLPLIASTATEVQKKAFLIGTTGVSTPEVATAYGYTAPADGYAETAFPDSGLVYYNTTRNTASADNANGLQIVSRDQIGLVYRAPSGALSHRTEKLHVQFIAVWPNAPIGIASGAKSCDINFYQRTIN